MIERIEEIFKKEGYNAFDYIYKEMPELFDDDEIENLLFHPTKSNFDIMTSLKGLRGIMVTEFRIREEGQPKHFEVSKKNEAILEMAHHASYFYRRGVPIEEYQDFLDLTIGNIRDMVKAGTITNYTNEAKTKEVDEALNKKIQNLADKYPEVLEIVGYM